MNPLDKFHLEGTVKRIPRIEKHTDAQLDEAIETAQRKIPDFYVLLHGIDAYMERRKRRTRRREDRKFAEFERAVGGWAHDTNWGDK